MALYCWTSSSYMHTTTAVYDICHRNQGKQIKVIFDVNIKSNECRCTNIHHSNVNNLSLMYLPVHLNVHFSQEQKTSDLANSMYAP
jgi:hypothetical protein